MHERYDPNKGEWVTVEGGRSPSPEPVYDRTGRRSNTRDLRLRERLQKERLALVEKMMTMQPLAHGMGAVRFQNCKRVAKIPVPVKEYPGYPFIGLILGPRGNTQKKLERETGTKIVIRGKGRFPASALARTAMIITAKNHRKPPSSQPSPPPQQRPQQK